MKIRTGFVSNSSSASFVLEIMVPQDKFVKSLFSYFQYGRFDKDHFISTIKDDIEEKKERIEELKKEDTEKTRGKAMNELWLSQEEGKLKYLQGLLPRLSTVSDSKLVQIILKYEGLNIHENELDNTEISGWTCMWNNIDDAGDMMKTLIAFVATEMPLAKHRFQVIDD